MNTEILTPITDAAEMNTLIPHHVSSATARLLERRLAIATEALNEIASFNEGDVVTSSFDEPASAQYAREALRQMEEVK